MQGVDLDLLTKSPALGKNSMAWLTWHLARIQDHHISELLGVQQIWITENWSPRFGLEPDPSNTGYGHSPAEAAQVQPDHRDALSGYFSPVAQRTFTVLEHVSQNELDRVVDKRWNPPVTMGVRLISVADDSLQHLGQVAYIRGLYNQ
jgi:hypothetical protein